MPRLLRSGSAAFPAILMSRGSISAWSRRRWPRPSSYQVLTKRHERMASLLAGRLSFAAGCEHIWWGVICEDRKFGLPRIATLQTINAARRFVSVEPLLEDLGDFDMTGIDWAIVGGESGPGARPMKPEWVADIRNQCRRKKVAFFFKQWGGINKKAAGRILDGKTYDEMPSPTPSRWNPPTAKRGVATLRAAT